MVHDVVVQNGENNATGLGEYRVDPCHEMHTDIHYNIIIKLVWSANPNYPETNSIMSIFFLMLTSLSHPFEPKNVLFALHSSSCYFLSNHHLTPTP